MKYLLVAFVVVLGLLLMRSLGRRGASKKPPEPAVRAPAGPAQMVVCAHCGVHLPRDEARFDAQGRAYCSDEHRLAGPG